MHTNEGIIEFKPSVQGLHYHNVSDPESNIKLMLVNTVRVNFEGYTHHKVERAREAQLIQGMTANPTEREFAGMLREQLLTNALLPYVTLTTLTNFLVLMSPTSGEKQLGQNRSVFESSMCRSLGILCNYISM